MIDLHDVYTRGFEVRNASDVLTTPSSNTCTISLPDGTSVTPTLTVSSTGVLRLDYPTTQEGQHKGIVETVNPDGRQPFEFDVVVSRAIVSLPYVRDNLNFVSTANDEEVRRLIEVATDFIESRVGYVVRRTVVETVYPSGGVLFLTGPVISLTTMVGGFGYPGTYNVANYSVQPGGMVQPLYGSTSLYAYPVTVTYVAGRAIVPELLRQAALDYIAWMWESQRGQSAPTALRPGGEEGDIGPTPTVPYRILQALEPYAVPVLA